MSRFAKVLRRDCSRERGYSKAGASVSGRAVMVAISERAASFRKSIPIHARGTKLRPSDIPCFDEWKRFCFMLREIANGENGRPLSALEAQKRAQAVLAECGYMGPGRVQVREPVVAPVQESVDTQDRVDARQSRAGTKLKSWKSANSFRASH
jgi:hypothetical protein